MLGLVVPVVWYGPGPPPAAVCVTDHVNLVGARAADRPLAGRPGPRLPVHDRRLPAWLIATRLQVAWPDARPRRPGERHAALPAAPAKRR